MKKNFLVSVSCFLFFIHCGYSQNVGVGTSNPQNKLHVAGGFRLDTLTGVNGAGVLTHDANGVVYGIKFSGNSNDVLRGNGSFGALNIDGAIGWLMNGNSGTNPSTNFLGTTDNQPLVFKVNNIQHGYLGKNIFFGSGAGVMNSSTTVNIAIGNGALGKNTFLDRIVAIGDSSCYNTNYAFPVPIQNTAVGYRTLFANISGNENTAIGGSALTANTSGSTNTAVGNLALQANTTGSLNTAVGYSMFSNTTGFWNTAVGGQSLLENTTGNYNTALGVNALTYNRTGSNNTAIGEHAGTGGFGFGAGNGNTAVGSGALSFNRQSENTAVGYRALFNNTVGIRNEALGAYALENNIAGSYNAAFGTQALRNSNAVQNAAFGAFALNANYSGWNNTAVGSYALASHTSGDANTAVGYGAGNTLDGQANVTCIGSGTGWNTTISNQVNIGNFSVSWIGGQVGWFHYSDKRMKTNIKDDVPGLAFITRLRPITYYLDIRLQEEIANAGKEHGSPLNNIEQRDFKGKYDIEKTKMTGFFAQDVEDAAKAINYSFSGVYNPKNGGLLSLDYSAFVVPLVKAVQEQQTIIEKQQKQIDDLLKRVDALEKK